MGFHHLSSCNLSTCFNFELLGFLGGSSLVCSFYPQLLQLTTLSSPCRIFVVAPCHLVPRLQDPIVWQLRGVFQFSAIMPFTFHDICRCHMMSLVLKSFGNKFSRYMPLPFWRSTQLLKQTSTTLRFVELLPQPRRIWLRPRHVGHAHLHGMPRERRVASFCFEGSIFSKRIYSRFSMV